MLSEGLQGFVLHKSLSAEKSMFDFFYPYKKTRVTNSFLVSSEYHAHTP